MDSVIIYLLWQYSVWENSRAFVLYLTVLNHHLWLILNPFVQTKAIQGVYDINPIFMMDASLRWESRSQHWAVTAKGNNIFNGKIKTVSRQGNQDFSMTVAQNWATFAISVTYKFGNYKPKKVKSVDTSRMGH